MSWAKQSAARRWRDPGPAHPELVVDFERTLDGLRNWEADGDEHFVQTVVRRLEEAAKRFGLDPMGAPEERTAEAIAADPLRDTIIGLLWTWRFYVTQVVKDRVVIDRLGRVTRLTRLRLGGAYARWQGLLDRKDWKGLAAFAATPELLGLGPQLVGALARDLSDTALDHEAARDLLRAAVERYPNAAPIRFDLGASCETMSPPRNLEALQQYAALVALKPDALLFQYRLAAVYAALGDYAQAVVVHRKAADRGSASSAMEMANLYLYQLGDLDAAIAGYRQTMALPPTTRERRYYRSSRREGPGPRPSPEGARRPVAQPAARRGQARLCERGTGRRRSLHVQAALYRCHALLLRGFHARPCAGGRVG